MRIVQIGVGRINPDSANGVSRVIYNYNKYLKNNNQVEVWGIYKGANKREKFVRNQELTVILFSDVNSIINEINVKRNEIDIVHIHMIWRIEKYFICSTLKKMKIPYVVSTHGGFSSLDGLSLKKQVAYVFYEKKIMETAAAIHALTFEEKTDLRRMGITTPIFVLPNGSEKVSINKNFEDVEENWKSRYEKYENKIKLLFLARGCKQKNPVALVEAISMLEDNERENIVLFLAGPFEEETKNEADSLIENKKLDDRVIFVGEVHGDEKDYLMQFCDIYCLPSLFEGLAVSMIEAMSYKKPCLITRTSNVSYYNKYDCFEMCEPWSEDIKEGISRLINRKNEWKSMGERAYECYTENFIWEKIVYRLEEKYQEIVRRNLMV